MTKHIRGGQPHRELQGLQAPFTALRTYPLRLLLMAAVSLLLVWLILTKSLPFALAPSSPDLALALNPSNPAALITKARQIRADLLAQGSPAREQSQREGGAAGRPRSDAIAQPPGATGGGPNEPGKELE